MKNKYIKIGLLTLVVTVSSQVSAQVKVGDNPQNVNSDAVLEIESTNKGMILPRIALEATTSANPMSAHVAGMTVYNTATAGTGATAVTPGYYYNDGTQWVRVATGADAKTEPWFVQNTTDEATANDQNIYQQGKVAVGFTDADAVSAYQLEVKGDFKSEYTDSDGWIKGISNNAQSILGDGIIGMYSADNENFTMGQGNYDQISLTGNPIVGGFSLSTKRDTPDGPNAGTISAQNTAFGMTIDMQSTNAADDRASRISLGGIYRVNLTDKTTGGLGAGITITDHRGVQFRFDDATGATEGVYDFPRNNGTAGQVLTTDGSTGIAQLSWADASSLVDINEPWRIQNTTTDATANDDDIYQQGKVAVGFTDADAVSDKQFEVKGDMKAVYDNGAGTYNIIDNNYDYYMGAKANMILSSDDEDVNSATKANFVFSSNDISNSGIVSVDGGLQGGVIASTNTILGHAVLNAIDNTNGLQANVDAVSAGIVTISGGSMSGTGNFTEVMVDRTDGVRFRFGDSSGSNTGQYLFPKTNGSANQVLTTNGSAGVANLSWQDVSTLAPEPWRVQGTTNEATANTENIFQLGSVAIGANTIPSITTGSGTVNPMLHVAGDVSTTGKFYTTSSVYADYVFEKYFDGTSEINDEYEFNSLDYIKAFIEENKHLPGVTKIDDLLKNENGYMFDMTELSIQQLEKIEELFIHVIEQNQQIIELKNQVEDNNKRLEILENLLLENNSK